MADIPLQWRAYAAHQSKLNSRTSVDATSHGMEAGLNYLLEGGSLCADAVAIERVIASAARRDRYARSLLAKHMIIRTEVQDPVGQIEARSSLALLRRQMPTYQLDLLVDLAMGTEPAHLANSRRLSNGAMRTRVARARRAARAIAV